MRAFAGFRAILCLSTALMMVISWPLWVTGGSFPRVPWFGWVRLLPAWASWARFVATIAGLIVAANPDGWTTPLFRGREPSPEGAATRRAEVRAIALGVALVLAAWMVLEDQFRLQPWMYQFLLMGSALVACSARRAATLCRWLTIAIYFHSGLSKLEPTFSSNTGLYFLHYLARPIGIEPWSWSDSTRKAATLLFPCWEIGVASALALGARRTGVACAILQHLGLLVVLGPWGLEHSRNVLIWNVAMALEVACLFWPSIAAGRGHPSADRPIRARERLAKAAILAACVLPFAERIGWWDTWPSFGLYSASDAVRIAVWTLDDLDGELIDLSAWSLDERRVPIYPSGRALNGVAEVVAGRYRGPVIVDVLHSRRPSRAFNGPAELPLRGLDAIRKHGDTFWLNAHPAR